MSLSDQVAAPVPEPARPRAARLELRRSLRSWRSLFSAAMSALALAMTILALTPLFSVLWMVIVRGGAKLRPSLFIELPPAAGMPGGGIGNAVVGTILMVAIASAIAVPLGILAAVFIGEFAPESRASTAARFAAKILTGMPSILAGVFAYTVVVLATGTFSAWAGGFALAILMVPIVVLTAADAIQGVPRKMREAAIGMGATRSQVVWHVVLPTARPAILTGVMLAVARAAGETAPLLFTALFFDYWPHPPFTEPTSSLAVLIYNFSGVPYPNMVGMAWTAALVLVVLVLATNIIAQVVTGRSEHSR
ncbi:MAG: phosphate ABC transporter permease PstA [Planctomycetaceae bacterium]|nr:phosphate ABC transporter permease PstA [Planctomycetaceae bacterium]MBV8609687.1 phosphate ABC transporter permease PstA [Singulisphaera sp.]